MASYKSKSVTIEQPVETLFEKFSDLSNLGNQLDKLPADQMAQIGSVKFENDCFIISTPQLGDISFAVIDKTAPDKIIFGTPNSPVPLQMIVNLEKVSETVTNVSTSIDVEIPAILRPMIGPKMQQASDKFGELIANLAK